MVLQTLKKHEGEYFEKNCFKYKYLFESFLCFLDIRGGVCFVCGEQFDALVQDSRHGLDRSPGIKC